MEHHLEEQYSSHLDNVLSRLKGVRKSSHGWVACCPAHHDRNPSLSIAVGNEGRILLKCFAGCELKSIVEAMGLTVSNLFLSTSFTQKKRSHRGISLLDFAENKLIPWKFLFNLGISEEPSGGLRIPYHLPDGTLAPRYRIRTALVAKEGSRWSKGPWEIVPYGLERLTEARKDGYLIVVEGESDSITLWLHHFQALGLPGADMGDKLKEEYLEGINRLYIYKEPDSSGTMFVSRIEHLLQQWKWPGAAYAVSLSDVKDSNDLHKRDWKSFQETFQLALDTSKQIYPVPGTAAPSVSTEVISAPLPLQVLLEKNVIPAQWAIKGILPEGLILLAGKPKQGKSWLALEMALAVSTGTQALGTYNVTQGGGLYLALEDNERRLQARTQLLLGSMERPPTELAFAVEWPRLDQGGFTHLDAYLKAHPQTRLVVIDTWAKIAPHSAGRARSSYEVDYLALTPLKRLADAYHVSIVLVHHLRKTQAKDVLDEITGSTGLVGAVDAVLVLKRERSQEQATLFLTGRDIEQERTLSLIFDPTTAWWKLDEMYQKGDHNDIQE